MYPAIKLMMIRNLTKLQSMTNRKKIQNLVLEDKPKEDIKPVLTENIRRTGSRKRR
jgi:hypothetical protein